MLYSCVTTSFTLQLYNSFPQLLRQARAMSENKESLEKTWLPSSGRRLRSTDKTQIQETTSTATWRRWEGESRLYCFHNVSHNHASCSAPCDDHTKLFCSAFCGLGGHFSPPIMISDSHDMYVASQHGLPCVTYLTFTLLDFTPPVAQQKSRLR